MLVLHIPFFTDAHADRYTFGMKRIAYCMLVIALDQLLICASERSALVVTWGSRRMKRQKLSIRFHSPLVTSTRFYVCSDFL